MPNDKDRQNDTAKIPDVVRVYLENFRSAAEHEACTKMLSDIDGEENSEIRQFMQDTLENYCEEESMRLSYIYETYWHQWINEQKALQKDIQPIELYIALESILANQSDSSEYTKTPISRRYPLCIPGNYSGEERVRHVDQNVPPARFLRSLYKFGVHKFRVGHAIKNILDHLEERYNLDFDELERIYQSTKKCDP